MLRHNLILQRIEQAAMKAGREPGQVKLVAVSKGQPAASLRALAQAGQLCFGESYLREAEDKIEILADCPDLDWHFIGRLQSNKSGRAVKFFSMVESVHKLDLARRLSAQAGQQNKSLDVLIQVNLAGEASKSGCNEHEAESLAQHICALPHLRLRGLMTLPPLYHDPEKTRPYFARLRRLAEQLGRVLPPGSMQELSMGMSSDFEAAIAEGATLVRVGTALFGSREE